MLNENIQAPDFTLTDAAGAPHSLAGFTAGRHFQRRNLMLNENTQAPDFTLTDAAGAPHSLADFRGQWVVLYFYPRDNTPGCTRQACAFASAYGAFQAKNAVVIGVSKDSAASHQKFAAKYELPFLLLSPRRAGAVRRLEREKAVRQGQHGHRPLHLPDRPRRDHPQSHAQGQAGHERRRCAGHSGRPDRQRLTPSKGGITMPFIDLRTTVPAALICAPPSPPPPNSAKPSRPLSARPSPPCTRPRPI